MPLRPCHYTILMLALLPLLPQAVRAQSDVAPTTYELMLDGETYTVEANRLNKLTSQRDPSVKHTVVLRVAPTQTLKLNSVQFTYDWLTRVQDNRQRQQRTASLTHQLGFTMLITDLGQPLPEANLDKVLKILADSVVAAYPEADRGALVISPPRDQKFATTSGRGLTIKHRNEAGIEQTSLAYVLNGQGFAVSCIVQYNTDDFAGMKHLVKQTLDSFQAAR